MELNERKWFYETPSDSNLANNCQDNKCVMANTSKHSGPLRREVTAENCDVLPYHQIICSVPCKIHSRKPPLNGKSTPPGGGGGYSGFLGDRVLKKTFLGLEFMIKGFIRAGKFSLIFFGVNQIYQSLFIVCPLTLPEYFYSWKIQHL